MPGMLGGLQIQQVSEMEVYFNYMIYGEPGAGKTVLSGSADDVPEMRPVLLVDMEGGTASLRSTYPNIDVIRVKSWPEMQQLYNTLYETDHGYRTVIIDSLSEVQKFHMLSLMEKVARENPKMDIDVPSMREWGISLEQMRKFVRGFRDLPINTIFTCLSATEKDAKTGKLLYRPALSGKLSNEVAGFLDEVFYLYVKESTDKEGNDINVRCLLTGKTETIIAKDRSGSLDLVVTDPVMSKVYKTMINSHITENEG